MKKTALIIVASLAIGTAGFMGCSKTDTASDTPKTDTRTAGEKTSDALTNAGQKTGEAVGNAVDRTKETAQSMGQKMSNAMQPSADTAMNKTRDTLTATVEAAVSKDGLGDVVDTFTKADRDRIGKLDKSSWADYNMAVDKFRADWKAKYNEDFKISDKEQLVFAAPVKMEMGGGPGEARMASDKIDATLNGKDKSVNNMTTVMFPASGGAPAVKVSVQNEGTVMNSYKIDVPDTLEGNKLRDNLAKHIGEVDGMKDQWPSDKNEAYRIVSQHILAAITDTH